MKRCCTTTVLVLGSSLLLSAQQERPLRPPGSATAMVGGQWATGVDGNTAYEGADFGVAVRAGTPLWRAGANQTTVLRTEVPLVLGATNMGLKLEQLTFFFCDVTRAGGTLALAWEHTAAMASLRCANA